MVNITDKEFKVLADYVKDNYGIHLKEEKKALVTGRLQNVLQNLGFSDFTQYYHHIAKDATGEAVRVFVDKITTNHTFFMREAEHFNFFKDEALPNALRSGDKDLRVWCAACSSGEESYTLAMIINDYFNEHKQSGVFDKRILATDISLKVLETAKAGIYKTERIQMLPSGWRNNYFKKMDEENSIVSPIIRNEVIYRKFNLMEPVFPFKKKFHAIFCRNVMIYFDNKTKERLINKLYDVLEYGGYLFIGLSESLNRETTEFKYVRPSVYRKL